MEQENEKTIRLEDLNEETIKDLVIINNYVPIAEKINVIDEILNKNIEYENGVAKINRLSLNIALKVMRLPLYTNLSVDEVSFYVYDLVCLFGLEKLIFSEKELLEWDSVLENAIKNVYENNTYKDVMANYLKVFENKIIPIIEGVDKFLDKGDPNKIAKYLSNGMEKIADYLEKQK